MSDSKKEKGNSKNAKGFDAGNEKYECISSLVRTLFLPLVDDDICVCVVSPLG